MAHGQDDVVVRAASVVRNAAVRLDPSDAVGRLGVAHPTDLSGGVAVRRVPHPKTPAVFYHSTPGPDPVPVSRTVGRDQPRMIGPGRRNLKRQAGLLGYEIVVQEQLYTVPYVGGHWLRPAQKGGRARRREHERKGGGGDERGSSGVHGVLRSGWVRLGILSSAQQQETLGIRRGGPASRGRPRSSRSLGVPGRAGPTAPPGPISVA